MVNNIWQMPRERGDSGQYVSTVEGDDVLSVFEAVRGPVVTSADVAEVLDVTRETARRKLNALVGEGTLDKRKTAGRVVYWAVDTPTASPDRGHRDDEATVADRPSSPDDGDPPTDLDDVRGVGDDADEAAPEVLDDQEDDLVEGVRAYLSDRPPRTAHGTAATLDVVRLLRERGTMKTGELKEALYAEYGDQYGSERAMWESISRYLDEVPGVAKGGYGEWAYTGDEDVRETLGQV